MIEIVVAMERRCRGWRRGWCVCGLQLSAVGRAL